MLDEYFHLISDPAHMAAEITLMIAIDGILLGIVWPFFKRWVRKHDREVHGK